MAANVLRSRLTTVRPKLFAVQNSAYHHREQIGNRDIVGYGMNGTAMYADHPLFPMPSVRFRENDSEVLALRQKEKGDWKKLSMEEKKQLYRASFCQTYSEMKAPTGTWKIMVSGVLIAASLSLWYFTWLRKYVYGEFPSTFSPEAKEAQLKRMIDLRVNPIDGLASHWDYEKGRWKE